MVRITFIYTFIVAFSSFSQYDGKEANEVSTFRPGSMWFYSGLRPSKVNKAHKYDRLIFDITYNDWVGDEDLFDNNICSMGLNTNFMFDIPLIKDNSVSLGIGLSYEYKNIRHDNQFVINNVDNKTVYQENQEDLESVKFKKSSLIGNSFSIPLELRFRNKSWKHFKVHLGGKIGYQVNTMSKRVYEVDGHKEVYKLYHFPDVNRLIYSVHARLGLRNWALYFSYNLNPIFSNQFSTQLNLVQMGLSVSLI